jgi:DNA polymerase V
VNYGSLIIEAWVLEHMMKTARSIPFEDFLIENREAAFIVRAESDALKDEGILRGDMVLVDKSKDPKTNDIVLCVLDGGFALRRLEELPKQAKVEAVVTAVIRKY